MCPSQQSVQVVAAAARAVPQFFVLSCKYPRSFQAVGRSDTLFAASTCKDLSPDSMVSSKTSAGRSLWSRSDWECASVPAKAFPPISSRFKDTFVNVVGHRVAESSLQLGSLHPAPEAHRIGLVDELVPEEKLKDRATAVMQQWLALPGKGGTSWAVTECRNGDLTRVGGPGIEAGSCVSVGTGGVRGWEVGKLSKAV